MEYYERPETSNLLDHIGTASYGAQNDNKKMRLSGCEQPQIQKTDMTSDQMRDTEH